MKNTDAIDCDIVDIPHAKSASGVFVLQEIAVSLLLSFMRHLSMRIF